MACQFFNLAFPSKSNYVGTQCLYLLPAVDERWGWMWSPLADEFQVLMAHVIRQGLTPRIFATTSSSQLLST